MFVLDNLLKRDVVVEEMKGGEKEGKGAGEKDGGERNGDGDHGGKDQFKLAEEFGSDTGGRDGNDCGLC